MDKEDKTFRIMVIAVLVVIMGLLVLALMNKEEINDFIQRNIFKNPAYLIDTEEACPTALALFYYSDHVGTTDLEDDEFYLAIKNPDDVSYEAEIFVNDVLQDNVVLLSNSTTQINSKLITRWWREGVIEDTTNSEEEVEDSVEEEEGGNNRMFYVDIRVKGCNETIIPFTPNQPTIDAPNVGGGGGELPSSRYSISIWKDYYFYLPD